MAALAYYSSSSEEDSSDVDQDILSLHQSSASSRTTLRSNSPGAVHQPAVAGLPSAGACEHIIVLLEDEEQREKFLKRHKALLTWGLKNASDVRRTGATLERPSKRRKVCRLAPFLLLTLSLGKPHLMPEVHSLSAPGPCVQRVRQNASKAVCLSRVFICGVLARCTHCEPSRELWARFWQAPLLLI